MEKWEGDGFAAARHADSLVSLAQLLLRHIADANNVNGNRETPMDVAAGKATILELLQSTSSAYIPWVAD